MKSMNTNSGVFPFLAAFWVLSLCGCRTMDQGSLMREREKDAGAGLAKVVMGYYPSWKKAEFNHTKVHYENLTHIMHAFTKPDAEGNLIVGPEYVYPELVAMAHARGVKVIMSIGGSGNCDGFAPTAADPAKRERFIGQIVGFCKTNGYDGADIDWEFVSNPEEQRNFVLLVKELSARLKAQSPPLLLTTAVPSGDDGGKWINYEEIASDFDYISFMTYDYHGDWSDHAGHNAPLYSCEGDTCGSMNDTYLYAVLRKVPNEKLVLGIPFYGRSFNTGWLYQRSTKSEGTGYAEIVELEKAGWRYNWDFCSQAPYLRSPDGGTIITFDDMRSVYRKCRYVLDKGAAGFIIWEISEDSVDGAPQLLNVIGTAFRSR
jgi:chitinase